MKYKEGQTVKYIPIYSSEEKIGKICKVLKAPNDLVFEKKPYFQKYFDSKEDLYAIESEMFMNIIPMCTWVQQNKIIEVIDEISTNI